MTPAARRVFEPSCSGGSDARRSCVRRDGKEGLFQVMSEDVNPWPALQRYGITPETLTGELRKELMLEPYRVL